MNVHSYTIIHYGADYIGYALKSIHSNVSQSHVIYTPYPSHGHQSNIQSIETIEEIQRAIYQGLSNKVHWYEMQNISQEGQQRDLCVQTCIDAGANLILVVDCDEIWDELTLTLALQYVWQKNEARNWLVNFTHLWRSFNYCCRDEGWPVRIIDTRHNDDSIGYIPKELGEIYHFGYAVTDKIMEYKWQIHGHKDELRPTWYNEKWLNWEPGISDVHPTNEKDFWTPEEFDKSKLPDFMKQHPFWEKEKIE